MLLESAAAERAKAIPGAQSVAVIGTQQVRITFDAKGAEALRSQIAAKLATGKPAKGDDTSVFVSIPFDFLPQFWPSVRKSYPPVGDCFVTEYATGEELIATLYEASGLWFPITALEFEKKLHVRVPESSAKTIYDKK